MNELAKKVFSLLSVIRGYNIIVLIAAQYLAAIFIFSNTKSVYHVLFDWHLLYLILATVCVVASGYIINNFYDDKVDQINRPIKTSIDKNIKQETQLSLYFLLNFTGFCFSTLVSWRAALFFSFYIFSIWLYSHKLKKYPIAGWLTVSILTILPFFVVFVHYKNFSKIIFIHASFLFLIILIRELIKDLENMKGAIVNNYKTFPIAFGEKTTKTTIFCIILFTIIPICVLLNYPQISYMKYYFYFAIITVLFIGSILFKTKVNYQLLHNVLKILLLIGIFSLLFIDKTIILEKLTSLFI